MFVLLGAAPGGAAPGEEVCATVEACVARLVELGSARGPQGGITNEDEALGRALAKLGPDALPRLTALLEHRHPQVRESAAYALGFFDEAAKPAIPALTRAVKNKVLWAAWALGRTKDASVIPTLRQMLLRGDMGVVQLLEDFGEAGVAVLVEALEDRKTSTKVLRVMLDELDSRRGAPPVTAPVVPRLAAVLADARRPPLARRVAILWLAHIGPAASEAIPELRKVRDASGDEQLRDAASDALTAMGEGDVVANLIRALDNPDGVERGGVFANLGRLGPAATPAIPRLSELLRTARDWEARERAAEALGWTRSPDAVPVLLEAALGELSWRVQYEAVTALGRVGSAEALPMLAALRREHWFGPVRRAAERAMEAIELASRAPRPMHHSQGFWKERWAAWDERRASPEERCWDEEARQWRVRKGERWLTLKPVDRPRRPDTFQNFPYPELRSAQTSFHRVEGGWLMGVDKGEFGGALWFLAEDGSKTPILETEEESFLGFAELPGRLLAFTGMAHMGLNEGFAHTLTREGDGTWTLHHLAQLPGFPKAWRIDADITLVVATGSGVVELAYTGVQRMLPCP
ncbi:HEAT repeat domain-containing protein [Archangium lipolyticum]|uniref:HEAT repeat domain-containing protein n=1 Tax=Archangium lipolyticum TaxID=2970465 RepID=UPI002149C3E8|nr:HEAT repeat domain-containing protein [Archangium lipolyticum]